MIGKFFEIVLAYPTTGTLYYVTACITLHLDSFK